MGWPCVRWNARRWEKGELLGAVIRRRAVVVTSDALQVFQALFALTRISRGCSLRVCVGYLVYVFFQLTTLGPFRARTIGALATKQT